MIYNITLYLLDWCPSSLAKSNDPLLKKEKQMNNIRLLGLEIIRWG
jgi:hypothetical protein